MAIIPYDRITNLQNDQALNPTDPYPAPDMDAEYNALKITTDDLIQHLDIIQRDDGQLENNSVGFDQLREEVLIGFDQPAPWLTNHNYVVGNTVFEDEGFYYCNVAHLSGVFATDLAAGKWSLVADFAQSTEDAQAAAAAAAASAAAAATDADQAQAAAAEATAAQGAFRWNFSTTTTMADPGIGNIRGNGSPASSMTQIAVSANTADAGNPGIMPWLVTWDDSTNTTSRGTLYIRKVSAPQNFAVFDLTGTVVNNGAWAQIGVTYVTHAGTLNNGDPMSVAFMRTGNAGTSGSGTGDMLRANNLDDVVSKPNSRTNLGLGTTDAPTFSLVTLTNPPTVNTHGANKLYVDNAIGGAASLTVSDTPPVGKPDGALWWESDSGQLYVRYNDGSSTQWVVATPQPDFSQLLTPSQGVRYDVAQSLNATQQTQARSNIYAAPLDAMAYSGMQINGSMEVRQELSGNLTVNGYVSDGWFCFKIGTMVFAAGRGATALYSGFPNYLFVTTTTAQPSLGAGDLQILFQKIEGYRIARLGWGSALAQSITIGFWTNHVRTGIYSVSVQNGSTTRSYVATYTQNVSNASEYKTIVVPGCTDGTWAVDETVGMQISFTQAAGSTLTTGSPNTWVTGNFVAATGQVNAVAATSDSFRITGVVILPGSQAPTAAQSPLIMRPYDQELLTCQRYFFMEAAFAQLYAENVSSGVGANAVGLMYKFPVTMRAAPTWTQPTYVLINANAPSSITIGLNSMSMQCVSNVAAGARILIQSSTSFKLDARL